MMWRLKRVRRTNAEISPSDSQVTAPRTPRLIVRLAAYGLLILPALVVLLGGLALLHQCGVSSPKVAMTTPGLDWGLIQQPDNVSGWTLRPGMQAVRFCGSRTETGGRTVLVDCSISTNDLGFRGPPVRDKGDRFRILAIGDSTTFGLGVQQMESWPSQLQQILDPGADNIEVINAGVPGYSSVQGLRFLEKRGLALHPDLVIATFGTNDCGAWNGISDLERYAVNASEATPSVGDSSNKHRARLTEEEFEQCLKTIADLCRTNGARVLFLAWPNRGHFSTVFPSPPGYYAIVKDTGRKTQAPVVDVLDAVGRDKGVLLDSVHFNARGCRLVAEAVARTLTECGLLPANLPAKGHP